MRRLTLIISLLLVAASGWLRLRHPPSGEVPSTSSANAFVSGDEISYHGERVRLAKSYWSYDSYKDDAENIAPSELSRVQQLVNNASITQHFSDKMTLLRAVQDAVFPGYGWGSLGRSRDSERPVSGFSVEIPQAGQDRYLIFAVDGGDFDLVDDFVASSTPAIMRVAVKGADLEFRSLNEQVLLRRPFRNAGKHP